MAVVLNPQITGLKESSTLAINARAKKMRNDGEKVFHWGFGQSPFSVHPKIQEALKENSDKAEYLPTLGLLGLRESIRSFYQERYHCDFPEECILIGPGSKELLFQAIFVLEGPLIIPSPSWVSYGPQAHIRGKQVISVPTKVENSYKISPEELEYACRVLAGDQQKIIIINNPNNPTGAVYTKEEVDAIVAVCRKNKVVVISDEIYSLVNFEGCDNHYSFLRAYPEGTLITSGMSKGFSAGGYRMGFAAGSKDLKPVIDCLAAMVSETFSAVTAPISFAAISAFDNDPEIMSYVEECGKIHKAVTEYMYNEFLAMKLVCPKPEGAFYLYPHFQNYRKELEKKSIYGSEDLCNYLLENHRIAVLPSTDFYCPDQDLAIRVASVDYDGDEVYRASKKYTSLPVDFVEKEIPQIKEACEELRKFVSSLL